MTIEAILAQIDSELARLQQARALLSGNGAGKALAKTATRKRRVLSPEARKRIADAQKKRWAAQKKTVHKKAAPTKKAAKKTASAKQNGVPF